jgi:uncharacterized protein
MNLYMTNRKIFISHAVKDVKKSTAFFRKLGFTFNKQFTGKDSGCIIINKDTYIMFVAEPLFKSFTKKKVVNAKKDIEVGRTLQFSSRKEVDMILTKAIKAGAKETGEPTDIPGMYSRDFEDLDGHNWGISFMGAK